MSSSTFSYVLPRWWRCVSLSFRTTWRTDRPRGRIAHTRVSGVITSVNCSLGRSYAKDVAPLGISCERRASRPHELSSLISGFLRPNRPDFAIQYARYFRRSHISRAIMPFDGEYEVLIANWKIAAVNKEIENFDRN